MRSVASEQRSVKRVRDSHPGPPRARRARRLAPGADLPGRRAADARARRRPDHRRRLPRTARFDRYGGQSCYEGRTAGDRHAARVRQAPAAACAERAISASSLSRTRWKLASSMPSMAMTSSLRTVTGGSPSATAHRQLLVNRRADLSDQDQVQRRVERLGDLHRHRHAAARQGEHHHLAPLVLRKRLGQAATRIRPVVEGHDRPRVHSLAKRAAIPHCAS